MVNTLLNKVLSENEKCAFYFCLKTEGTFWPTKYLDINTAFALANKTT